MDTTITEIKALVDSGLTNYQTSAVMTARYGTGYSERTMRRICKEHNLSNTRGSVDDDTLQEHIASAINKVINSLSS